MGKRVKAADLVKEYIFSLDLIRKNEEARKCLCEYLEGTLNTESLDFMDAVDQLVIEFRKLPESKVVQFKSKLIEVITTYVEQGAPREINISSRDRTELINISANMDAYGLDLVVKQFINVRNITNEEMSKDVMPRFIRSPIWFSLVNTKKHEWLDTVGVLKKAMEMQYSDADFQGNYVEDSDIEFMRYLSQDSYDWKLSGWDKNQKIMAFQSDDIKKFFPNVSWVKEGCFVNKYVGILHYPFDFVEHYMLHAKYVSDFDANILRERTVQYLSYEDLKKKYPWKDMKQGRSVCVMIYDLKFPLMANRVYCVNSTAMYDPVTDESITMSKPCYHEELNQYNLKKTPPFTDFQIYSIKKLDDNRTMYYQMHVANLGSKLGNKLSDMVVFTRGKQLSANIDKFMKEREGKPIPENDLKDGLMRPLIDHKEYLKQQKHEDQQQLTAGL
ncbi:regulator of G-protein signaling [Acrasis kona]|uniref:Regulator of G-protein signaling n=1 Tax=Acrasis kona TaxID=1008807 RepID=A0AAW2ZLV7_9EUKA